MKTCYNCGGTNRNTDLYCRNCGCRLKSNTHYILINIGTIINNILPIPIFFLLTLIKL